MSKSRSWKIATFCAFLSFYHVQELNILYKSLGCVQLLWFSGAIKHYHKQNLTPSKSALRLMFQTISKKSIVQDFNIYSVDFFVNFFFPSPLPHHGHSFQKSASVSIESNCFLPVWFFFFQLPHLFLMWVACVEKHLEGGVKKKGMCFAETCVLSFPPHHGELQRLQFQRRGSLNTTRHWWGKKNVMPTI